MVFETLWNDALFGRDNRISFTVGLASVLLAISCYGLVEYVFVQTGLLLTSILFVVLVLGGGAAGSSYWNDGLIISWLFVFAPTFGLTCALIIQRDMWFIEDILLPLGWSAIATGLVGTVGYGTGRALRKDEKLGPLPKILVGEANGMRLISFSVLSMCTSAPIMFLSYYKTIFLNDTITVPFFIPISALNTPILMAIITLGFWVLLAGSIGYIEYSLFDCWSILFGAFFGATSVYFVLTNISGWSLLLNLLFAFLAAAAHSLVIGVSGYFLGYSARQYEKQTT